MSKATTKTALIAFLAYVAFNLLLPMIPLPAHRPPLAVVLLLTVLSTAAFMLLQLWLAQSLVNLRPRPLTSTLIAIIGICVWFGVLFFLQRSFGLHHHNPRALLFALQLLLGLSVTLAATFLGILLSPIVREVNVLLPVALVAMPIDYLGAMTPIGFTNDVLKKHPNIVQVVSVPVPTMGGATHGGGLHPIGFIGPGDILFLAFFFAVVLRLDLNVKGTFWIMFGLLTATILVVLFTGINIAALIPMGLAVLIANGRSFKLKREEVFATLYAALLVIALASAFYAYSHTHFFHSRS